MHPVSAELLMPLLYSESSFAESRQSRQILPVEQYSLRNKTQNGNALTTPLPPPPKKKNSRTNDNSIATKDNVNSVFVL